MSESRNQKLLCHCCSGKKFVNCCQPYHLHNEIADTPEKMMRSRYSAYVEKDLEYITRTWLPKNRPESTSILSGKVIWLSLAIVTCSNVGKSDVGTVEFIATYIESGTLYTMHETSDFIRIEEEWYYVSGDNNIRETKISRSAKCPCNSGKKFKRCCGA